jgi:2-dehydropantoate 2-reductase
MHHIDELKTQFGFEKVIGGLCVISSKLDEDGTIVHYNDLHALKFGELSGETTARIEQIQAIMQPTKISWLASTSIQKDMWEKWAMLGSLASITCLMRASVGQVARSPGGPEFAGQLFDECLSVLQAYGYEPDAQFVQSIRSRSTDEKSTLTASMLRDIERGGKVEADHILGDLIARAEAKKVAVPMLKVSYCHLKAYEARKADGQ